MVILQGSIGRKGYAEACQRGVSYKLSYSFRVRTLSLRRGQVFGKTSSQLGIGITVSALRRCGESLKKSFPR